MILVRTFTLRLRPVEEVPQMASVMLHLMYFMQKLLVVLLSLERPSVPEVLPAVSPIVQQMNNGLIRVQDQMVERLILVLLILISYHQDEILAVSKQLIPVV